MLQKLHVNIEINGSEIPLLDGSAIGWIEEIKKVGMINSITSPRPRPVASRTALRTLILAEASKLSRTTSNSVFSSAAAVRRRTRA